LQQKYPAINPMELEKLFSKEEQEAEQPFNYKQAGM